MMRVVNHHSERQLQLLADQEPRAAIAKRLRTMTFSPFIDPAGMLGFLLLTSPERVGFLDGKEAFQ